MQRKTLNQKKINFNSFFSIVFCLLLLFSMTLSYKFSANQGIKLGPIRVMSVLTGSMEPKIPRGSMIFLKDQSFEELTEGDIITFFVGQEIVTHRIISIDQQQENLLTKGDANQTNDQGRISKEAIIGKFIFGIPFIGGLLLNLKTPLGLLSLGLTICLIMLIKYFIRLLGGYQYVK